MPAEIEAKMKVEDFDDLRRRLRELGAEPRGSVLEMNEFFDTSERSLVEADKGLRLRSSRDAKTGEQKFVLTFKGPQQAGELKNREEAEVRVDDPEHARRFLAALGYQPTLSFEKRRESWRLGNCKLELDELPVLGRFIEIEGPDARTVEQVRQSLGLGARPLIKTGYATMLASHMTDDQRGQQVLRFEKI